MRSLILTLSMICLSIANVAGQVDKPVKKDKQLHLVDYEVMNLKTNLLSFSLVDSVLYNNFENGVKTFQSDQHDVIVFVATNEQIEHKLIFWQLFSKKVSDSEGESDLARYQRVIEKMKIKFGTLQFKSEYLPKIIK